MNTTEKGLGANKFSGDNSDIVSRYQEPIDEKKLDELAKEILSTYGLTQTKDEQISFRFGFKAGYRKAMEEGI